jgi:putative hydrolase of the HAD superfamily
MIRALIFDLDDTLYRERDFRVSGFRAVAEFLSVGAGYPREEILAAMVRTLDCEGRGRVMASALERFPGSGLQIADLVEVYRRHVPSIRMFDGYAELLHELRVSYRLGILTDGAPEVQRAKCAALGLVGAVDHILCTWDNGESKEKPHPLPFHQMLGRFQVGAAEALFIGDSLEKDIRGSHGVGMRCVRVEKPSMLGRAPCGEDADFVLDSLLQLPLILRQLGDQNEAA